MLYKALYKWLAVLLCASLCASGPVVNVIAASDSFEPKTENEQTISTEFSDSDRSETNETISTEVPETKEGTAEFSESEENSSTETSPTEEESEAMPSSTEEISDSETTPTEEESETVSSSTENAEESETISTEETSEDNSSSTEDLEESETICTEEISEFETMLSEALTETETETETLEETIQQDELQLIEYIEEATDAFSNLLEEKTLMALLYHTDSYQIQSLAGSYDDTIAVLESGHTLYIRGVEILADQVWYLADFYVDGEQKSGYIEGYYLAYSDEDWIDWEQKYLAAIYEGSTTYGMTAYPNTTGRTDTSDIDAFPAIYRDSLRALKNQHPSWTFVPMNTGLDFNTAVSNEMGAKSLIQKTSNNTAKGWVGSACPTESGWYYATQPAVAYHMNPVNFLTESSIFQFEQLTFNAVYHNVSAIQTFLNNTFMKGKLPDDASKRTYAQVFYEIGKNRRLSPIHLASRVYQEQGNGTSALISGTYSGYEGYYNYFNVGVNGSSTAEKVRKGLTYAKNKGWNTRYKSLEGGAATIGNNYILKGQDTIYLEKFNVDKNSPHGLYNHQYMQNIQAPASESASTKKMYANAGSINSGFVFKIPVFKNMPGEKTIQSIMLDKSEITLYRPDVISGGLKDLPSTGTLTVSFTPADTTDDKTITWTSSNPKIVSVTPTNGQAVVSAIGIGEVTITAKSKNNKTAKCKVKVEAPLYHLSLANLNDESDLPSSSATLYKGQNITLTADYLPKDTTSDTKIVWTSSEPAVATVADGKITALSKGTTVITAKIGNYTASYTIFVESSTVTFMSADYTTPLKEVHNLAYGETLPQDSFPEIKNTENKLFIGWYTSKDGLGTRFDTNTKVYEKKLILYPYFEEQGKGFYVIPVGDQTYTGAAIKPAIQVYDSVSSSDGNTELIALVKDQDYTVSYKNNKNVNTSAKNIPTITVKGKGNYSGTAYVHFNIIPKSLTDHDITANHITVAYNGKVQKSAPAVYRNGKKLVNKTDYTLTYPYADSGAYKGAGVYPIIIKGIKNYTGTLTVYETISKKTLLSKVTIAKIPNQTYKNELVDKAQNIGIIPSQLNVTYKKKPLIESTDGGKTGDYTVRYSNNMAVGTATATITAVEGSDFTGSKSITYKIVGQSISKAKADGITAKTFTRTETDVWQNQAVLTYNNTVLTESKDQGATGDYLVSYANISKPGTATVIFKGINEYSGQLKKTYKITAYDISDGNNAPKPSITIAYATEDKPTVFIPITSLSQITSPYMKGSTKPQIKLYYYGAELTQGKDYTVKYANNTAITTSETAERKLPKITITGKGHFKGSFSGTWNITDGAMSDNKLTMTTKDVSFKKKANSYKTTISIADANGKKLTAGKDYDKNVCYTYEHDTQVTTADGTQIQRKANDLVAKEDIIPANTVIRATVKGIGSYIGDGNASVSATYRIISADIAKAKLKVTAKVYQNGNPVKLEPEDIKLTFNNTQLVYGTDYIIEESSYANHTKKGKATVILRGTGANYGGQRKITYTISSKKLVWWKTLIS